MSETNTNVRATSPRTKSTTGSRLIVGILALIFVGLILFVCIVQFGSVTGVEFSPDTFKRRSFFYYEIPLLGLQISPIRRTNQTGDLESHLITKSLINANINAKPVWDVASLSRGGLLSRKGDAGILCTYLDIKDDEYHLVWLKWSKDNVELAKTFWPEVARLARNQSYFLVPELFHLAEQMQDAKELRSAIYHTLARRYRELGQAQQQLGKHDVAVGLLTEALSYTPDDPATLRSRAESYTALGEPEKASTDQTKIDELDETTD